jgi:chromosome segregation ATPase
MSTANPTLFWFLVEITFILTGVSVYLFMQRRKLSKVLLQERQELELRRQEVEQWIKSEIDKNADIALQGTDDEESIAYKALHESREAFLVSLLNQVHVAIPFDKGSYNGVFEQYQKTVQTLEEWAAQQTPAPLQFAELQQDQPAMEEGARKEPVPDDGLLEMEQLVDIQREKIRELLRYKESLEELRDKFKGRRTMDQKLLGYLRALKAEGEPAQALRVMIERFENSSSELQLTIVKLEQENAQFETIVATFEMENERLSNIGKFYKTKVTELVMEKGAFNERLKHLEQTLEKRTHRLESLQGKYTALKREYTYLYDSANPSSLGAAKIPRRGPH